MQGAHPPCRPRNSVCPHGTFPRKEPVLEPGAQAVLFGRENHGEPTAQNWAEAADTIVYEIVTRIGTRVPRVYANDRP